MQRLEQKSALTSCRTGVQAQPRPQGSSLFFDKDCVLVFYRVVLGVRLPKMSRATAHTVSAVVVPVVPAVAV